MVLPSGHLSVTRDQEGHGVGAATRDHLAEEVGTCRELALLDVRTFKDPADPPGKISPFSLQGI